MPKSKPPTKRTSPPNTEESGEGLSPLVKWGGSSVLVALLLIGCYFVYTAFLSGPSLGNITGKVYLGDKLLGSGKVIFTAKSGISVTCIIRPDGTYEAKGIERGELFIAVMQ